MKPELCILSALLVGAAASCSAAAPQKEKPPTREVKAPARAEPRPPAGPARADAGVAMETTKVRSALPANFDVRVRRALELPVAADLSLAVLHVAMGKSPRTNYRFTLAADGALRYVQHSGTSGDWQVPFDRPLPEKPSTKIEPAKVSALVAKLRAAGFFAHPGYEADPQTEDGAYVIVQARDGGQLHSVVYQNVPPPLATELSALSDPLWRQPR